MIYVVSDIYGCKECFDELMKKIKFSKKDTLYILGNILDKGPDPVALLMDLSYEPNIVPILGDRDFLAYKRLKQIQQAGGSPDPALMNDMKEWLATGGAPTLKEFLRLGEEDRDWVLEYLEEFSLFAEVEAGGKKFLLTHAGISGYEKGMKLEDLQPEQFITGMTGQPKRFFPNYIMVYGHTPTECEIEESDGSINVNCDCIHGGMLAAYCLDNGKKYYVNGYDGE